MDKIKELFLQENIVLTDKQAKQFFEYRELLLEYNQKFNLTAIKEEDEITIKHFIDSALGHKYLKNGASVVDIGSGAGFPAIPIKILNPTLKFTLLDALNKRVDFLKKVCEDLELSDMICLHERAEDHAVASRNKYDYAVARAVSSLSTLAEYALPLLRLGGELIAYKGDKAEEEKQGATKALQILGGQITKIDKFLLNGEQNRSFIVVEKTKKTPLIYPRGQNKPKNSPL
jgi:16S rRNA (guanine527-N7)-methyltransferase